MEDTLRPPSATTLQPWNNDPNKLQEMYNRMHVTGDERMLKLLLLELGSATATFKDRYNNYDQRDFVEILVFYDNTEGNVSFGVRRTQQEETTTNFFPLIFQGINRFMSGRVLLYICFKAVFGCAIQVRSFLHSFLTGGGGAL